MMSHQPQHEPYPRENSMATVRSRSSRGVSPSVRVKRHDITKLYYSPAVTVKAMNEDMNVDGGGFATGSNKSTEENNQKMPKLFQPTINPSHPRSRSNHHDGGVSGHSRNGEKCDVFEHLYQGGLEMGRNRLMNASPASFRHHGKMWDGMRSEGDPRDPTAGDGPSYKAPWTPGGNPRPTTGNRCAWKQKDADHAQQQQQERAASRVATPRRGPSRSILHSTNASKLREEEVKQQNAKRSVSVPPPRKADPKRYIPSPKPEGTKIRSTGRFMTPTSASTKRATDNKEELARRQKQVAQHWKPPAKTNGGGDQKQGKNVSKAQENSDNKQQNNKSAADTEKSANDDDSTRKNGENSQATTQATSEEEEAPPAAVPGTTESNTGPNEESEGNIDQKQPDEDIASATETAEGDSEEADVMGSTTEERKDKSPENNMKESSSCKDEKENGDNTEEEEIQVVG